MRRRPVHVLLTLALALCCHAQDAPKPTVGSVSGILTDSVTGAPISRATINLTPIYSGPGIPNPPPGPATVTTLSDGTFAATELQPARYIVSAQKAGYLDGVFGAKGDMQGTPISVHAGDSITEVVFSLTPGVVISGTVQNEDGEPFSNVNVFALHYRYFAAGKRLVPAAKTTTNDRGEYRFHELTPGTYYVACSSKRTRAIRDGQNSIAGRYPLTYYPSVTDFSKAVSTVLGAGNEAVANVTMTATRTYSIQGRISGADPGAHVTVEAAYRTAVDDSALSVDVDDQRGFVIKNVPPGSYRLRASGIVVHLPGRGTTYVTVEDNDLHDVLIELLPAARLIRGTFALSRDLYRSHVDVQILLRPGMQLTDEEDDIMPPPPGAVDSRYGIKYSGNDFQTLTADRYTRKMFATIRASGDGSQDAYVGSVQRDFRQDVTETGFDPRGTEALFVEVRGDGATVKGTVVDRLGQPVPGATVSLFPDDPAELRPDEYRNVNADQKGEFEIHGVVPRAYKIVAFERVQPAALRDPQFLQQFVQQAQAVNAAPKTSYVFSLVPVPALANASDETAAQ